MSVMMAITFAKIGRSMKKRENMKSLVSVARSPSPRTAGTGELLLGRFLLLGFVNDRLDRIHRPARPGLLQAVDNDPIVRVKSGGDSHQVAGPAADCDRLPADGIVGRD